MALWQVYENFVWRISQVVPTEQAICGKNQFEPYDKTTVEPTDSSGLERSYIVTMSGGGPDIGVTDMSERDSEVKVSVQVVYWPGRGWRTASKLLLQDQNDLVKSLRDDRLYLGYDADHTTDDIGLISRHLESWQIMIDDDAWMLEQTWMCQVKET